MSKGRFDSEMRRGYAEHDRGVQLRASKVGCVLILILMPLGSALDYVVYPSFLLEGLLVRLGVDVLVGLALAMLYTGWGKQYASQLSRLSALLVMLGISWMIYSTEGAMSPYYAGLNLVLVAMGVLMPWRFLDTVLICVATMLIYLAACYAHSGEMLDWNIFANNLYFLSLTALIASTSAYYRTESRVQEFWLRYQLGKRNEELTEMDRMKSEFFANISHELRTPLTLIISPIDDVLSSRVGLDDKSRKALELAKSNSLRLLRLINNLLEVVRVDTEGTKLQREPIELRDFARGVVDSVRYLGEMRDLQLACEGDGDAIWVLGDLPSLEKILVNLLTNAIKFTPEGGRVGVCVRATQKRAIIEVEDTGVGIAKEELPHIFDRFRQGDRTSGRSGLGMGIGLALARELAQEQKGELSADSEVGRGTRMRLELSRIEAPVAQTASALATESSTSDKLATLYLEADRHLVPVDRGSAPDPLPPLEAGKATVLVVDDEADMRRYLVSLLANTYRVLQADNGSLALELARTQKPDLVVLDYMMPGMDGLEVCSELRAGEATRHAKIIMLTARADEHTKLAALEARVDDFLGKPFSALEVRIRVTNLLEAGRLERELAEQNQTLQETLGRLRATETQLVQSEKMNALGNLAAGLLHEINNPLNYTLTAVQLVKEMVEQGDEELAEILKDIDEGMRRIRDIVVDLRAFAYPDRVDSMENVELGTTLETAKRFTSKELVDGIRLDEELAEGAPVRCSKSHISQVFVNVLTNAIHATASVKPAREPRIVVRSRKNGTRLLVSVEDNGIGIPPDNIGRVFDPFFTTKDVGEGMGLGLSVCHTIIQNHGGTMSVESTPGEGSVISFDLPLAERE